MLFPTTCLTHGTELKSATHIKHMQQFLEQNPEVATLPLTDVGNVSQCVEYYNQMTKIGKKPVFGCQVPLCETFSDLKEDSKNTGFNVLMYAQNIHGWQEMLKVLRYINDPDKMCPMPRISMEELQQFDLGGLSIAAPLDYSQGLDKTKDFYYRSAACTGAAPDLRQIDYSQNSFLFADHADRLEAVLRKGKAPDEHIKKYARNGKGLIDLDHAFAKNNMALYDMIEEFDIRHKEELPAFCDDDNAELIKQCEAGLIRLGLENKSEYRAQLQRELDVFIPKGFAGYFLIMADIVTYLTNQGYFTGIARGSAGGCLVSYLTGITQIDPVEYGLMFERFYSPDRTDYPDIDLDLPPSKRDELVQYIADRYGEEKLGQLSTFGTIKGSAALKLCLGNSGMNFFQQNAVTGILPQEAKVAPQLKDQNDEFGTKSLVLYSLRHYPEEFDRWVSFDPKTNRISGKWAKEFQLAIDLDGTHVSIGKHASAFVLANKAIYDNAPMRYDTKSKRHVVGVEMNSASDLGLVKLDLLSLDLLDKAKKLQEGLRDGSFFLTSEPWKQI